MMEEINKDIKKKKMRKKTIFDKNEKISKACYYKQMILLSYKKNN